MTYTIKGQRLELIESDFLRLASELLEIEKKRGGYLSLVDGGARNKTWELLGFIDFSITLLRDVAKINPKAQSQLISWWQRDTRSWRRKLKDNAKSLLKFLGSALKD